MADPCKCGWREGDGIHRCHARLDLSDYTRDRCENEGKPRERLFPDGSCLAGAQMKLGAYRYRTHACDECWAISLEKQHG